MSGGDGTPSVTSKGPEQKSARSGSGPSTLVIALVALLVVALVGCGWLVKVNRDKDADVKAGQDRAKIVEELQAEKKADQDAVTAAKAFVTKVTTYSYQPGQHDFAWVKELLNEKVRTELEQRAADLQKAIVASKTSAKGEVVDAMGRVVDATQVEVLAFVDQGITDPSGKVSVEESAIRLVMKKVDEAWRVDSLTFLNKVGA